MPLSAILLLQANMALAIEPASSTAPVQAPAPQAAATAPMQTAQTTSIPFDQMLHTSRNPFDTYRGKTAPPPSMANSARLDSLIRDGKLYLSLRDAIDLALENNLDLVIARYNLPIAQMDILRTKAGGFSRGVNTGVVSGTPGGGGAGGGGADGRRRNHQRCGRRGSRQFGPRPVHTGHRHHGLQLRSLHPGNGLH